MRTSLGLCVLLLASSCAAVADSVVVGSDSASGNTIISTGPRHDVLIPVDGVAERVCWFDGQKFSKGARIKAGNEWLVCARENDYETNGALSWRSVGELSPQSGSKIQIN